MTKWLKTITVGRLVVVGCYIVPTPHSTEGERKAPREISSAAQMTVNANRSQQRLELLLAANFGWRDLHVVLTYDDEYFLANRQVVVQRVCKMSFQLRAVRKPRGQELKYIYATEQLSSEGGRFHHHMVVNGIGADLDVLWSLWPYGEVELETLDTWQGYEALAKHLTKEPKELGKPEVGARNWAASIGLTKPKAESEIVRDNLMMAVPSGVVTLSAPPPVRNKFGEFVMLEYYLPIKRKEEKKGSRPPRRRKKEQPACFYSVWEPGVTSPRGGRKCMEKLQKRGECGKLIARDGWLVCPSCRRRKVLRVRSDIMAKSLIVYCRDYRTETMVDTEQGQCFESQYR